MTGGPLTGEAAAAAYASLVTEDRPVYVIRGFMPVDPSSQLEVELVHLRFPGVKFTVAIDHEGLLTRFQVTRMVPGRGLSARQLRQVPVGELHAYAMRDLRGAITGFPSMNAWKATLATDHRPGRRGRPDRFYAELAADYVALLTSGSKAPVKELAEGAGYSESQIRNLLHEARSKRRAVLTATPNGRAGGALTEKAKRLLAEED